MNKSEKMVIGVLMGLAVIGLWLWAEIESNRREDKLKERVELLERWVAQVQAKNGY